VAQIVLDNVTKAYPGNVLGVDGLSLQIADGEFVVLVGPSGCGKSTALRSIAGLEQVTGGTITIGGRVVNDVPPKDRDIAMVFQNYALYPHMSVWKNLAFGLQQRRTPKDEVTRRVAEVAAMLGITEYLARKPAALSGGQRQRVAMGRAIVREPAAFLMDEPLSNLDAKLRVAMRASLAQLHARLGVTTVYVTHDQVEAMTLGQRVAVLRDGRLQQADTPQALFARPANLFVAGFIGSPAMNFTTARLHHAAAASAGGAAVSFAGHTLPLPDAVAARPGLAARAGTDLIIGIRPSDFDDPDLAAPGPGWATIPARADVTEELGSETHVIFTLDTPPLDHPALASATTGTSNGDGDDPAAILTAGKTQWTARVPARTRIRPGQPCHLAIDTTSLHFFDPDSGLAIGHPEAETADAVVISQP
jgi:multiple sugar transport system ATP-binding protein